MNNEVNLNDTKLNILTFNVWFREDVDICLRLSAIGQIIRENNYPHFICLQEVTQNIIRILAEESEWIQKYYISEIPSNSYFVLLLIRNDIPTQKPHFSYFNFENSIMGRNIVTSEIKLKNNEKIKIATSHLESPINLKKYNEERKKQLELALKYLQDDFSSDIIYAGDFNWINEENMSLNDNWEDLWLKLNPNELGYTYDTIKNDMIKGIPVPPGRLDRILFKFKNLIPNEIKLVGNHCIENKYVNIKSLKGSIYVKKAFPSDHFGLLATFVSKMKFK